MAVVASLAFCRAVVLRVLVSTFHALGIVYGNSILMYRRGFAVAAERVVSSGLPLI